MYFNATWLTGLLLFVGGYYLFLFIVSFMVRIKKSLPQSPYFYFLIVPAKNEEKVIENTVNNILKIYGDNFRLIVTDDGSTDTTSKIVQHISEENKKVILLHKPQKWLKRGKGAVLNYSLEQIKRAILGRFFVPFNLPKDFLEEFPYERIVIGVFDADARPSSNILTEVSKVLNGEKADAVQTAVRISNRNQSLLARMQDVEFLGFSRIVQKARSFFGSVGLGGNGQFTLLTALDEISAAPWGDTLTEDLELGLRLISKGKKITFTDSAIVAQEGLTSLKAIIRQRTRWLQGHFMNWRYIPSILRAPVHAKTRIDTLIYIVFVSVVFLVGLSIAVSALSVFHIIYVSNSMLSIFYSKNYILYTVALLLYSLAFIPMFIYSVFKFYGENSFVKKTLYVFLFAAYTYIWLPAGIIGLYNLAMKHNEWTKTERVTGGTSHHQLKQSPEIKERRACPRYLFHTLSYTNKRICFIDNVSCSGVKVVMKKEDFELIPKDVLVVKMPYGSEKRAIIVWKKEKDLYVEAGLKFTA